MVVDVSYRACTSVQYSTVQQQYVDYKLLGKEKKKERKPCIKSASLVLYDMNGRESLRRRNYSFVAVRHILSLYFITFFFRRPAS